jgi:hypothetical protein
MNQHGKQYGNGTVDCAAHTPPSSIRRALLCHCRAELLRWRSYFHFKLAGLQCQLGAVGEAIGELAELTGELDPRERALRLLCLAILHMQQVRALELGSASAALPSWARKWNARAWEEMCCVCVLCACAVGRVHRASHAPTHRLSLARITPAPPTPPHPVPPQGERQAAAQHIDDMRSLLEGMEAAAAKNLHAAYLLVYICLALEEGWVTERLGHPDSNTEGEGRRARHSRTLNRAGM